jgi:hypothetical protein
MARMEEHPDVTEHDTLIDTTAAAARIGMAPITLRIWRWRDNPHQPPYVRVGSRGIRYDVAALDAWQAARTHKPGTKARGKHNGPGQRSASRGRRDV